MSLESAMNALNKATPGMEAAATPTMPTNMNNSGANITDQNVQASQETKENGDNSLKTDKTDGVVDATKSAAEATTTEKKEEETAISVKFSALAKKEKAILKQRADFETERTSFAAEKAAFAEQQAKFAKDNALWETDIFAALEAKGYSYQKLTDMILSGKALPDKEPEDPITIAKKMTEDLRNEFSAKEKAREEAIQKAEADKKAADAKALEEAYTAYRGEIDTHIKENAKDYRLTKLYAQEEMIVATVQEYYEKHRRVLSVKEASDLVENYLRDEVKKATSALEEPKIEKKDAPKAEEAKAVTKTLSNNLTPTTSPQTTAVTQAERMKRAMAALNKN